MGEDSTRLWQDGEPVRDVTRAEYDFAKLTPAQRRAVDSIAIGGDGGGHAPRVLARLVEKGFIVEDERTLPGFPPVIVKVYDMPIGVHMRWAEHCSREADAEEAAR